MPGSARDATPLSVRAGGRLPKRAPDPAEDRRLRRVVVDDERAEPDGGFVPEPLRLQHRPQPVEDRLDPRGEATGHGSAVASEAYWPATKTSAPGAKTAWP
ncbi:hypothetical protein AB0E62_02140 [Streptomyces sp. NPDC038707]|uniref:hypothetical protein n=1 Tax=Streptomyces sp. NPDC038707 TaxID=3154329 RepID=UPI0033D8BFEF